MHLHSHHRFGPRALLIAVRQAAFHRQHKHVCGWCLGSGKGNLIKLGNMLVLDSHVDCVAEVQQNNVDECRCLDPFHPGDDSSCPVHGGKHAH